MEMEKSYYVVTSKPAYFAILRSRSTPDGSINGEESSRFIVSITQGGFGQDVVDDERQTKERFLEYLFYSSGFDLPRTAEVFDQFFELEQVEDFVDLDEEL